MRHLSAQVTEEGGKHKPFGADGSGYYSDNTKGCYDVIKNASDLVLRSCGCSDLSTTPPIHICSDPPLRSVDELTDKMSADDNTPFVVADYGTADGGTSMPLMYAVVERVRAKLPNKPIFIWYEDQAQNDFKSLFLRMHQLIDGPPSYLTDFDNVYCMASGTTFYQQCFPDNSVDLGFSATAFHWLTSSPCQFENVLHSAMAHGQELEQVLCHSPQLRSDHHLRTAYPHTRIRTPLTHNPVLLYAAGFTAQFQKQAAVDWESILVHRAKELKPGGQMVVVNFAVDESGSKDRQFLGQSDRILHNMHGQFCEHWKAMADEGRITQEEFRNTNFPNHYRTVDECRRPFDDATSALNRVGVHLDSIETRQVPCPYQLEWAASGGDAAQAASTFVPTTRTWSNSVFEAGLDASKRSPEECAELANEMYGRYEAEVAKDPAAHAMDYVHSYMRFSKEQK